MTPTILVFDAGGGLIAAFDDWDAAHGWAHDAACEPGAWLPLEIEDRARRLTWSVSDSRCQRTAWRPSSAAQDCPPWPEGSHRQLARMVGIR
jgi:hypothetical protein